MGQLRADDRAHDRGAPAAVRCDAGRHGDVHPRRTATGRVRRGVAGRARPGRDGARSAKRTRRRCRCFRGPRRGAARPPRSAPPRRRPPRPPDPGRQRVQRGGLRPRGAPAIVITALGHQDHFRSIWDSAAATHGTPPQPRSRRAWAGGRQPRRAFRPRDPASGRLEQARQIARRVPAARRVGGRRGSRSRRCSGVVPQQPPARLKTGARELFIRRR